MAVDSWDDVAAAKRVRRVIEGAKLGSERPGGLYDSLRVATAGNGSAARSLQTAIEAVPVEQRVNVVGFALKPYGLTVTEMKDAPLGIIVQLNGGSHTTSSVKGDFLDGE